MSLDLSSATTRSEGPSAEKVPLRVDRADWPQLAALVIALLGFSSGYGHHLAWLVVGFLIPVGRYAFRASFRRRVHRGLSDLWASCDSSAAAIPWRAAAVLVVLPSLVLFLSNDCDLETGDTWPVVVTAHQLVCHGSCELSPLLHLAPPAHFTDEGIPYGTRRTENGVYSRYPSGMVPFAVPVVAAARLLGTNLEHHHVLGRLEKWTAAWVAALSLGLFFLAARELSDARSAGIMSLVLAVGSVFATTCSQALWQQGGVIFWALVALFVECRRETRPIRGGTILQGTACAMMFACRPSAALFAGIFGLWVVLRSPRRGLLRSLICRGRRVTRRFTERRSGPLPTR
jgi:hypothetical protein